MFMHTPAGRPNFLRSGPCERRTTGLFRLAWRYSSSLTGLCLDDAEDAVNALNQLEIACQRTARKMVDLPHASARYHDTALGAFVPGSRSLGSVERRENANG